MKISNNLIGTLADGNAKLADPNARDAVQVEHSKNISVVDNVINAIGWGMMILGDSRDMVVQGNRIGVGIKGGNIAGRNTEIQVSDFTGQGRLPPF